MSDKLSPIMEDYIETILLLSNNKQVARVKDISKEMDVTMSTVTSALKKLQKKRLILYRPYSTVSLTLLGRKVAENVYRRHKILTSFFYEFLSLPPKVARDNACRIEHQIDDVLLERLIDYIEFIKLAPGMNIKWDKKKGFVVDKKDEKRVSSFFRKNV